MDRQEANELLANALNEFEGFSYNALTDRIGDELAFEKEGRSGVTYQIEIQIVWDDKPGDAVRVLGSIDDGGWRAFLPICDSLLIEPQVIQ